jgi:hypothetical protein
MQFSFKLLTSDILNLEKMMYVPNFSRNLIYVSKLVPFGYSFNFYEASFKLFYKSKSFRNSVLFDDLF